MKIQECNHHTDSFREIANSHGKKSQVFKSIFGRRFFVFPLLLIAFVFLQISTVPAQTTPDDIARRNAEIERQNRENAEYNEKMTRFLREGNEAFNAKQYDDAIRHYDEGIAVDPAQFVFHQNKAFALKMRGIGLYNAGIRSTDAAAKAAGRESGRKDLVEAASSMNKAYSLTKGQPNVTEAVRLGIVKERAEIVRLLVKMDPKQAEAGAAAFKDYAAAETDPDLKLLSQTDAARLLFDAGLMERALDECKIIITVNPDNLDANLYAGLSIVALGDQARYRDGINYLQRFIDLAPDTHEMKANAKQSLSALQELSKSKP